MASETTNKSYPLHFVVFPFMAQGHMIPMVDIARLLAQRGVTVTIITTPHNAGRFKNVLSRAIQSGLLINIVQVKLPYQEAGLPEGQDNLDSLDSMGFIVPFLKACNMLGEPVQKLMEEMSPPPSCLISDLWLPYTTKLANNFNIPKIVFNGFCCFSLLCKHVLLKNPEILENLKSDKEYFVVPDFPDRVEFTRHQVPIEADYPQELKEFLESVKEGDKTSYGVLVNTFQELEPAYVKDFKEARSGKAWSIGPVSLCNKAGEDKAERGNKSDIDQSEWLKWLDSKEEGSVLYVCLGSMCDLPLRQLKELGLGLEETNRPFIWFIRGISKEFDEWISESGYEERIKDRGLVIKRWSPQMIILSHPSVGGFLTHCGWNSTLEGITSGLPLLTWPLFGDQFCNEKLVVQILKVGVKVGFEQPMYRGIEEEIGELVDKVRVKKAVEEVMGESDDAKERRKRVKELQELAQKAVEEGGSSHSNITLFLQDIMQLAQSKN